MEIPKREISMEQQALSDEVQSFIKEGVAITNGVNTIYLCTNVDALYYGIIVKEPKKEGG